MRLLVWATSMNYFLVSQFHIFCRPTVDASTRWLRPLILAKGSHERLNSLGLEFMAQNCPWIISHITTPHLHIICSFSGSREIAAFSTAALSDLRAMTHLVLEDFPFPSLTFLPVPNLERLCIDRWTQLSEVGEIRLIFSLSSFQGNWNILQI